MILVIVEPVLGRRKGKGEFIAATFFEANTGGDYANLAASYQTGKEEGGRLATKPWISKANQTSSTLSIYG